MNPDTMPTHQITVGIVAIVGIVVFAQSRQLTSNPAKTTLKIVSRNSVGTCRDWETLTRKNRKYIFRVSAEPRSM